MNAALKLFVANGVKNTSTAAIAKEAGTAAGTLFLYFTTKQDLIDELVLKISQEQAENIRSFLETRLTPREMFSVIWNASIDWFTENMEAYQYIQQVRDSGIISDEIIQLTSQLLSFYYDAIQKGLAENVIKPYPLELIGEILYRNIVAVINLIIAQPDQDQQSVYQELGFEIFWDGIKTMRIRRFAVSFTKNRESQPHNCPDGRRRGNLGECRLWFSNFIFIPTFA